jgi:predicted ribosome quality control (RQC) complex YloA/Tae2 family protein
MVRVFRLNGDVIVKIGQMARENDELRRYAQQNWVWVHLDGMASPHVIVECPLEKLDRQTLKDACMLCKNFSKLKLSKTARCIYTPCGNVHNEKTPGMVSLRKSPERILIIDRGDRIEELLLCQL